MKIFNTLINKFKSFASFPVVFKNHSSIFWFNLKSYLFGFFNFVSLYLTISKVRLILIVFLFCYILFFAGFVYLLWKSYLFNLNELTNFIYNNFYIDISKLNEKLPIYNYNCYWAIPSVDHIARIYNILGIDTYHDYINLPAACVLNFESLKAILAPNPNLQSRTSSIVLADIVNQNAQLFGDIGEMFLKKLFKASIPLFTSIMLLFALTILWKHKC